MSQGESDDMQPPVPARGNSVSGERGEGTMLRPLDPGTRALVRLSAAVAGGGAAAVRAACVDAVSASDPIEAEEVLLQSHLFAGFPRTLNAMREWRRVSGRAAPPADPTPAYSRAEEWAVRGEQTCAAVYGRVYEELRKNIRALHPALDEWMVVDGYGKLLSRAGLSLARRELCIIAACAAADQDRQLHAHMHGAINAGAALADVDAVLDAINDMLEPARADAFGRLWRKVQGQ